MKYSSLNVDKYFKSIYHNYNKVFSSLPFITFLVLLSALIITFFSGWTKNGLPGEDFPGNIAWIWHIQNSISSYGYIPLWSEWWFCGGPQVLIISKLLCFLIATPLSVIIGPISGLKITLALFHFIAGIVMYGLIRWLTKSYSSAVVGAIIYALHPLYLVETGLRGHLEVSLLFAFLPAVAWGFLWALEKNSVRSYILCAFLISLTLWLNNEGTIATVPIIIISILAAKSYTVIKSNSNNKYTLIGKYIGGTIQICIIAFGFSAFFLIPTLIEHNYHNLFDQNYVEKAIYNFGQPHLFYLFDRDGAIVNLLKGELAENEASFRSVLYIGIIPFILSIITLFRIRGNSSNKHIIYAFAVIGFLGVWLSLGPYSIASSFTRSIIYLLKYNLFIGLFAIIAASLVLFIIIWCIFKSNKCLRYLILFALAIILLFLPSFTILRTFIPIFSKMRSPQWFQINLVPLSVAIVAGVFLSQIRQFKFRVIITFAVIMLVVIDYFPYKKIFEKQIPTIGTQELRELFSYIPSGYNNGRYMAIETYTPITDYGLIYGQSRSAWSWLNWDCPKDTADFLFRQVYPRLHREDDFISGLKLAGIANIEYLIDDKWEEPNIPQNEVIEKLFEGQRFILYRNPFIRPYIQVYNDIAIFIGQVDVRTYNLINLLSDNSIVLDDFIGKPIINKDIEDFAPYKRILYDPVFIKDNYLKYELNRIYSEQSINLRNNEQISIAPSLPLKPEIGWGRDKPTSINVQVKNPTRFYLMISESFYPGWEVYVDNAEKRLIKANGAFMGVRVPEGEHVIDFKYKTPFYFYAAYLLTILTILLSSIYVFSSLPFKSLYRAKFFSKNNDAPITTYITFNLNKYDYYWITALCFFMGFVYYLTMSPTVTGEDSGELIAAGYVLGSPHPPGYPLWVLAAKIFTLLPIGGDIAYRVNWLSGFCAIGASVLAYISIRYLRIPTFFAFSGAAVVAFSEVYWSQAVIAEVYTPLALFTISFIVLYQRYTQTNHWGYLYCMSLLIGLGITTHYIVFLFIPVIAIAVLYHDPWAWFRIKKWLPCLVMMMIGLSVFIILYIRAQADPPMNWGEPNTISKWIDHIRRVQYKSLEFGENIPITTKLKFAGNFISELSNQFTLLLLPLCIFGLFRSIKINKQFSIITIGLFLVNTFVLIYLLHFEYEPENIQRVKVYYVPAYLIAGMWIGIGLFGIKEIIIHLFRNYNISVRHLSYIFAVIALLLPLLPLFKHYYTNDKSRYYLAKDYAENILMSLDKNAVIFPGGDYQTFPLAYCQIVENQRPDVIIGDLYGNLTKRVKSAFFESMPPEKRRQGYNKEDIERGLIARSQRPIYYNTKPSLRGLNNYKVQNTGIVYKIVRRDTTDIVDESIWNRYTMREVDNPKISLDFMGRAIIASYEFHRGELFLGKGNIDEADLHLQRAADLQKDSKESLNNIGGLWAEYGHPAKALRYFEKAIEYESKYINAHLNVASVLLTLNQKEKALNHLNIAISIDPKDARIPDIKRRVSGLKSGMEVKNAQEKSPQEWNNLGASLANEGNLNDALTAFLKAAELDPNYALPHFNAGKLLFNDGWHEDALEYLNRYLELVDNNDIHFDEAKDIIDKINSYY